MDLHFAMQLLKSSRDHHKASAEAYDLIIEAIRAGKRSGETSPEVLAAAQRVIRHKAAPPGSIVEVTSAFLNDARSLAGSALSQAPDQPEFEGVSADRSPRPDRKPDWAERQDGK